MKWQPKQYNQFKAQRRLPFEVLMTLLTPRDSARVLDLGCGTGALTAYLHQTYGAKKTLGVDYSAEMLAMADAHVEDGLSFEQADISTFDPDGAYDVIVANAALQWVPEPRRVLARLIDGLPPGGQLAVQVPKNDAHPSHDIARMLASREPFSQILKGWVRQTNALSLSDYASILDAHGMLNVHCRTQVFGHHLPDRMALLEWVKGSLLRAYHARMTDAQFDAFIEAYRVELEAALPDHSPFYYPFERILFVATKPS